MKQFSYRRPRLRLEHPLDFCLASGHIAGTCKDVSDDGLLVRLRQPVSVGAKGRIRWQFGGCLIEVNAYVAHTDLLDTGLRFDFQSPSERQFVQVLIKLLSKGPLRH